MLTWLKQLVGVNAGTGAGAGAPAGPSLVKPAAAAGKPTNSPAAADPAQVSFGVRKPLVNAQGQLAGFEFTLPPAMAQRMAARSDLAARAAHSALLMGSMRLMAEQGRCALAEISAHALARPGVHEQVASGAWLCLPDLAELPGDVAALLRARGVRLGLSAGPSANAPPADFAWLRATADDIDTVLFWGRRWQEARVNLPLVATGLASVEDMERVLKAGFALAGGQLGRRRSVANKPLSTAAHRICMLLSHLAMNRDTAEVADAVRADVALTYRLLRYANSAALGFTRSVDTVEQAVLLLGRRELSRWLQMLLMTSADSRQISAAMQEQALARGRLLELLAGASEPATANNTTTAAALFSVGLFSMLGTLLETPLAAALEPLRLSEPACQALLHNQGPWAQYLQLAVALDSGDPATADILAERWGGMAAVQLLSEAAWLWAAAAAATHNAAPDAKKPVS